MPSTDKELIWILDNDTNSLLLYRQTLGLEYAVRAFGSVDELISACTNRDDHPRLLIVDPENARGSFGGSFMEACKKREASGSAPIAMPEYLIASRLDQVELLRFYLKAGARDYILKPLRPNEIVAKVERAIYQISNREILILKSDLDGVQVRDLTLREHQMLTVFLNQPKRAVSREVLFEALWGKITVNKKTLDVHLFNLRRKLRPLGFDVFYQDQVFSLSRVSSGSDARPAHSQQKS